jgi:hypothetical protein
LGEAYSRFLFRQSMTSRPPWPVRFERRVSV